MRGVTQSVRAIFCFIIISIHTPHAGSDDCHCTGFKLIWRFQSTLPMRGVTKCAQAIVRALTGFQSTLPMRGVTAVAFLIQYHGETFQSTLPMRGVTLLADKTGNSY